MVRIVDGIVLDISSMATQKEFYHKTASIPGHKDKKPCPRHSRAHDVKA